ncbi:helix-turn-helix transcriptional regulator [filamentous cyanobacterium LEGE 11480]|uniref:Helix-turn-helix transcriptional regulator n=1 Tax=Romeriopsis navalis LEGE 11480 TaxID=2777977 RepID=A0A928VL59_9CYAN|nr:helix-turn-helix transcriptional regulator [Romeriopsis navalis]MBE9029753.1 helix-turn-helix transcriptional regulator [Romeriopsis navalis LEGE 11480]
MKPDKEPESSANNPPQPGESPETAANSDWQTSVQKIYDRKHQERQPFKEGDPKQYRQAAAEIKARQLKEGTPQDLILNDGLIDDSTPIVSGDYTPLSLPSPRGSYPYWRQITGTTFLEHEIVKGDANSQRVDFVFAKVAWQILQQFGIEAAYVFLLLTTRLVKASDPWEEIVELSTTDLLRLNIWERDRDISLGKRLRLAGNWFELVCNLSLLVSQIDGEKSRFTALRIPFWVLEEMEYGGSITHAIGGFQPEEAQDLTVRVGLGLWTEQFVAATDSEKQAGLAQFGHQAESILQINPTRKPLTAKLAILLLLLDRLDTHESPFYAVGAILEQVESKAALIEIHRRKDRRNTEFSRWNTTLHSLQKLGWRIEFDPETYPIYFQPAWYQPDGSPPQMDSEAAQWVDEWLQAQIRITPPQLVAQAPALVDLPLTERFTGKNLAQALEISGLSRSKLAEHLHLDRSMVTYWIKGARLIQPRHREQICELLGDELAQVIAS